MIPKYSAPERLLDFTDLGAAEVPDLEREPLERGGDEGDCSEELRVAVTGDDLRLGHGLRLEPEPFAGDPLQLGIGGGVRTDRARELAHAHRLERPAQPFPAAIESNAQPASFRPKVIGSA